MRYFRHVGVALTQMLNALLGGWPDESLSSRLWRWHLQGRPEGTVLAALVDTLFWWQEMHCAAAYLAERQRYQQPPMLRDPLQGVETTFYDRA